MIPAELPPGVTIPVLVPDYEDGDNDMEPGLPGGLLYLPVEHATKSASLLSNL